MSYKAGIIEAVMEMKDRNGSSMISIKKFMQAKLPKDKKWLNATFLTALKTSVGSGDFIQIKNSYKLSPEFKKKAAAALKPKKAPVKKAAKKKTTTKKKSTTKKSTTKKSAPKKKATKSKSAAAKKKKTVTKKSATKKTTTKKPTKKATKTTKKVSK